MASCPPTVWRELHEASWATVNRPVAVQLGCNAVQMASHNSSCLSDFIHGPAPPANKAGRLRAGMEAGECAKSRGQTGAGDGWALRRQA